jgi:hypothetical protein
MRLGKCVRIGAIASLVVVAGQSNAKANPTPLYRCTILDSARLGDNGRLVRDDISTNWRAAWTPALIDTATGIVRSGPDQTPLRWTVVRTGDAANDWLFSGAGNNQQPLDFNYVRLRPWSSPPSVMIVMHTQIFTGVCEVAH